MLHIHCGDTSAESLKRSGVAGEVSVWCDVLTDGPVPASARPDDWRVARAQYLSDFTRGQLSFDDALGKLQRQDAELEKSLEHDEVVLWFDACLYDQLILLRQLDWFSKRAAPAPRLSLICIGEFPGFAKFCGLGELAPHQLASLLDSRKPVSPAQFELASRAWQAFCSSDPSAIETLAAGDTGALPYLRAALWRHLEQFPSVRNGLSRLQNEALAAVGQGFGKLVEIFVHVDQKEERPYFGDTTLWACLDGLARGAEPLVTVDGPGPLPLWNPPRKLVDWTIGITDAGLKVLAGCADAARLNGIDGWLGGVHLEGREPAWRWDARVRKLKKMEKA